VRADALFAAGVLIAMAFGVALLAAPLALPPETVRGLDGRANIVDYGARWSALPLWSGLVYGFADLLCHQMEDRSWIINGNQFPVDARMAAAFAGATLALLAALGRPDATRFSSAFLGILRAAHAVPEGRRTHIVVALEALLIGPALVDVALQAFTAYESTNAMRAATGLLLGLGAGLLFAAALRFLLSPLPGKTLTRADATGAARPQP
jgi:uncharacterized membrane protein